MSTQPKPVGNSTLDPTEMLGSTREKQFKYLSAKKHIPIEELKQRVRAIWYNNYHRFDAGKGSLDGFLWSLLLIEIMEEVRRSSMLVFINYDAVEENEDYHRDLEAAAIEIEKYEKLFAIDREDHPDIAELLDHLNEISGCSNEDLMEKWGVGKRRVNQILAEWRAKARLLSPQILFLIR